MIVPVYFESFATVPTTVDDKIYLINDAGTYTAYNSLMQKIGNLSPKTISNKIYLTYFNSHIVNGRIWAIFSNKILVEINNT